MGANRTPSDSKPQPSVHLWGNEVPVGTRQRLDIEFAKLPAQARLSLPVEAVVGSADPEAPCVWLSAAIHGDEINGLEIITRVLKQLDPKRLNGIVLAVPIVNIYGFAFQSRYMPDRRDLNRSFPGSKRGSLAGRLARLFYDHVVERSTHGIDLHTGSNHRTNLPQMRTDLDDPECLSMATAFGAPVMIHGSAPTGSLRAAVAKAGKPIVVYEAGETLRFDPASIELGVAGTLRILHSLGMIKRAPKAEPSTTACATGPNLAVRKRTWVRCPTSGIFGISVGLGDCVEKGQTLGNIHEPLGDETTIIRSPKRGVVIGHTNNPLSYQGDALIHLALTN